jgi:hypothetical protein
VEPDDHPGARWAPGDGRANNRQQLASAAHYSWSATVTNDPRALPQRNARRWPARNGCPVGRGLFQPRILKHRRKRRAPAVRQRIGSAPAIMDDKALNGHGLHRMRGDADIGMGDPGPGAKQDHALLSGERPSLAWLISDAKPRLVPVARLSREVPPLHC